MPGEVPHPILHALADSQVTRPSNAAAGQPHTDICRTHPGPAADAPGACRSSRPWAILFLVVFRSSWSSAIFVSWQGGGGFTKSHSDGDDPVDSEWLAVRPRVSCVGPSRNLRRGRWPQNTMKGIRSTIYDPPKNWGELAGTKNDEPGPIWQRAAMSYQHGRHAATCGQNAATCGQMRAGMATCGQMRVTKHVVSSPTSPRNETMQAPANNVEKHWKWANGENVEAMWQARFPEPWLGNKWHLSGNSGRCFGYHDMQGGATTSLG